MDRENKNKAVWIAGIVILVIILLIFVPSLLKDKEELKNLEREGQLLQQGKYISDVEIVEEVINILKDRNEKALNQYLTSEFEYWRERRKKEYRFSLERFAIYCRK